MRPPRLAAWLLEHLLPRDRRHEAMRGDLLEEFRARRSAPWYWREALSLIVRGQGYTRMLTLDTLRQDIRFAWRAYAKAPGFTAIVVATLALGIGASTAIFSVVNGILLRPLPFADPGRLMWINETNGARAPISISWPNYLDWKARTRSFDTLAVSRASSFTWTGAGDGRRLVGRRVTANFFQALGVQPSLGRDFAERDDLPSAPPVAIVSDEFWRKDLGGAADAIGRTLTLDGLAYTLVGVLPAGFRYLRPYDVFIAMGAFSASPIVTERGNHSAFVGLGRLKTGVTIEAALRELQGVEAQIAQEHPDVASGLGVDVQPLAARLVNTIQQTLLVLSGAVGILLLIACANVANLLIARGAGRRRELSVRAALGAGRTRIAAQLLVESTLLSMAGGACGILLAFGLLRLLIAFAPAGTPRVDEVRLDGVALLFALTAASACGILFGALPAAQASAVGSDDALLRVRGTGGSFRSHRLRRGLLAAEVALALILLTGAGLMVRTLQGLMSIDPGFRPDHVITMHVSMTGDAWTEARRAAFVDDLTTRTAALPGVIKAGVVSSLPIDGSSWYSVFSAQDKPAPPRDQLPSAAITLATPSYFEAIGIRLLRGRTFTAADRDGSGLVIVINESLARRIWPGEDAVGKRIKRGFPDQPGEWREVVGVVADVKVEDLVSRPPLQIYMPYAQTTTGEFFLVTRTATDAAALGGTLEATIHNMDRDLPVFAVRTMASVMQEAIAQQRMAQVVLTMFAAVALLLASIGLYGLVAHSVTERTQEIGVRMAMGAQARDVLRLMLANGLSMTALGAIAGVVGAALLAGSLESLLYGVRPIDPLTFVSVVALLLVTSLVACLIPAARATRIAPTVALRSE